MWSTMRAQGGDTGSSEAGGGGSRARTRTRTRRGSQQRARDIVRGGLDQLREWGSGIVAEVRVLQASQHTSSTKTVDNEVGGATGQSPGQERGRGLRQHEKGARIWMVRAASNIILGRDLSRDRRSQRENEKQENGGVNLEPKRSTGVQSRVTPLTESRE